MNVDIRTAIVLLEKELEKVKAAQARIEARNQALASLGPAVEIVPLALVERRAILAAMAHFKGNRAAAAKALGIGIWTIRRKLHEYDVVVIDVKRKDQP
jgi:DNA-binding NtrC family response regulator